MALQFNQEYDSSTIINNKKIKFRPWTTRDEKKYLIAIDGNDELSNEDMFDILILPCIEDKNLSLTEDEKKMLMIEIRKKSLGDTFQLRFICQKCKKVNEMDVPFDSIVKFKEDEFSTSTYKNISLVFDYIKTNNLKDRMINESNKIEKTFIEFIIHIKEVEIDGKKETLFSFEELKEFIESLPSDYFDYFFKEFHKMKSKLEFIFEPYCIMCNHKNNIELEQLPNFLWM